MFSCCFNITNLDLSSFDTKNVTDMSYMFYNCNKLTNLYLSSFDYEINVDKSLKEISDLAEKYFKDSSKKNSFKEKLEELEKGAAKLKDEEFEKIQYNNRFLRAVYEGENKTYEETQSLINIVLENNKNESDIENRVIVRKSGQNIVGPSDPKYYENNNTSGNIITEECVSGLNTWTTDHDGKNGRRKGNNYVVAKMGTINTANGYKGDISVTPGKNYEIKYYYYNGKIKAIYIKELTN